MGSTQSKPERVVSFYNQSQTPFQLSNDLVAQLQDASTEKDYSAPSTQAYDEEEIEKLVNERAQKEAARLFAIEEHSRRDQIERQNLSTEALRRDMDHLAGEASTHGLKSLPTEVNDKRWAVAKCYLSKKDRPLECWKEVREMKEAAEEMRRAFVAANI